MKLMCVGKQMKRLLIGWMRASLQESIENGQKVLLLRRHKPMQRGFDALKEQMLASRQEKIRK